ncbi:MAG: hypothetical protein ACKOB0_05230, partial [Chthoniobacterales bacterium]
MQRSFLTLFVTPIVLCLAGCSVVGVKVKRESAASVRRDALQIVRQNGDSAAASSLVSAQQRHLSDSARATALLEAARLSSKARPGTPDHAVNVAATRGLLSLMAGRDFAPLPLGNGKMLGVSSDTRTTMDPRTATSVFPADNVRITKLRVRTSAVTGSHSPARGGTPACPAKAGDFAAKWATQASPAPSCAVRTRNLVMRTLSAGKTLVA